MNTVTQCVQIYQGMKNYLKAFWVVLKEVTFLLVSFLQACISAISDLMPLSL